MGGNCKLKSVVYKATVNFSNKNDEYHGQASNSFKEWYNGHTHTFRHKRKKTSTGIAEKIWQLKEENIVNDIKWEIVKQVPVYTNKTKKCELCLLEKTYILFADKDKSLNKRNEVMQK